MIVLKLKRVEARVSCGYTVIDFDLVSFFKRLEILNALKILLDHLALILDGRIF